MSTLRLVLVWPPTGFPDRPWLEHPDEDAFARSARSVCELYSEAVRQASIPARHSELRLACGHDADRSDVLVTVHPELTEGFELAVVSLPSGIAAMPAPTRSALVLEVVHAAALRLGRERGWNEAALVAARDHALAAGLRYRWKGPAKTSPDRRHTAQATYALHDDGYGRVVVQLRRRADGHLVASSAPTLAFSTSAGFARSARTLRWRSNTIVELMPYAGLSVGSGDTVLWSDDRDVITVDLDQPIGSDGHAVDELHDLTAAIAEAPAVTVQTPAETAPHIVVVGGGPVTDDIPADYLAALHDQLEQLREPQWQIWWSTGDDHTLEVWYDFAAATAGPAVRRTRAGLKATVRRPVHTFTDTPSPADLAHRDVAAMLALVARRAGLGAHPPLR